MVFKKLDKPTQVATSPEKLIFDLPRRKIPGVLAHQAEVMRSYADNAATKPDVALQLPTGSGKTLVGVLIAEWIRRKNNERVVYLAPTKQLVNQVVDQCEQKYGLQVHGFTGSSRDYNPTAKTEYKTSEKIAITTYSSLFNTNPFFSDAQTIIIDDAHASENYIAKLWSLSIDRNANEHSQLYKLLISLFRNHIDSATFHKLHAVKEINSGWIDKLPTPTLVALSNEIREIIDARADDSNDIWYPWTLIRDRLHACHLYYNESEILIRPLISPTWTHAPFNNARQRIYMSATLGAGGDLERLFGRTNIYRVPVPQDWDKQGVGRRLFLFPGMSLDDNETSKLRFDLMKKAGRSLVLVPSKPLGEKISSSIQERLKFKVLDASDIEESKAPFTMESQAVAVIANRYDGIDFPGEDCRLMFVEGLPKATNAQEKFLMTRMGANVLFNERVQTRVLQAIGRCTRSLEDYSAVVIIGDDLQDYLTDKGRRTFLHPEIQAELQFGIEQSKESGKEDFNNFVDVFLDYGEEWEAANQDIIDFKANLSQSAFPSIEELEASVPYEIEYQKRMWQGDYVEAMDAASRVLGFVKGEQLRGYRALWNYLAGSAALLAHKESLLPSSDKAESYFFAAKNAAVGLRWLVALATQKTDAQATEQDPDRDLIDEQVEQLERVLEKLGSTHDRRFAAKEKEIQAGLAGEEDFEQAHVLLGEMLGFNSSKIETDGSPDPWWSVGSLCIVFEDHAGAKPESSLSVEKARQAADHPRWIKENIETLKDADIYPALVSPVRKSSPGAKPHLNEVYLWPIDEFRSWADDALLAIREIRKTFIEPGDLVWRANAATKLRSSGLDLPSIIRKLRSKRASDHIDCSQ